jgi:hypothetical protein
MATLDSLLRPRRRVAISLRLVVTSLLAFLQPFELSPLLAYQEDGHYYTTYLVLASMPELKLSRDETRVVAFCAELPDKTYGLDATISYTRLIGSFWQYLGWLFKDDMTGSETIRMITIEQLLHGLTGGNADTVTAVATSIIKTLATRAEQEKGSPARTTTLCSLGFAIHLLGDSFAHRQLEVPKKMYRTGFGHAGDFTFPDLPMFNDTRETNWIAYSHSLATARAPAIPTPAPTDPEGQRLDGEVRKVDPTRKPLILTGAQSCLGNDCNEGRLREEILRPDLAVLLGANEFKNVPSLETKNIDSNQSCQDVLKQYQAILTSELPICEDAWTRFRDIAKEEFRRPDARGDMFKGFTYFTGLVTQAKPR